MGAAILGADISTAFSPTSIPGLILWLKADASTFQDTSLSTPAVLDTDPVGGWQDLSGQGHHVLQATAGKRPLLKLAIQNSKPVLRADGLSQCLQSAVFTTVSQPVTWFAAMSRTGALAGVDREWWDGGTSRQRLLIDGTSLTTDYVAPGTFVIGSTWGTIWHVATVLYNGAASLMRKDGILDASGTGGTDGIDRFSLCANNGLAGSFMPGDLGEVIVYQGDKTANFAAIEAYLKVRWGTP